MSTQSSIEWTDATWNPVTGCDKVSPGCKHCYAERVATRLSRMPNQPNYKDGFKLTLQPHMLENPLKWRKPQNIFVNSMSDLFHKDVPETYIQQVFDVMRQANWHQFQVLTKRSERLLEMSPRIDWPQNVWMGVSIESAAYEFRADHLRQTGAGLKFLSVEPLIGPIPDINLDRIDWVIVGGESGPGCRPLDPLWVEAILRKCEESAVPFFFKQWGGRNKKKAGRQLNGIIYDGFPANNLVQIRNVIEIDRPSHNTSDGMMQEIWRRVHAGTCPDASTPLGQFLANKLQDDDFKHEISETLLESVKNLQDEATQVMALRQRRIPSAVKVVDGLALQLARTMNAEVIRLTTWATQVPGVLSRLIPLVETAINLEERAA